MTSKCQSRGDGVITHPVGGRKAAATDDRTMQQSLEIIRRRVDEVGTREPTIQRQGARAYPDPGARNRLSIGELKASSALPRN